MEGEEKSIPEEGLAIAFKRLMRVVSEDRKQIGSEPVKGVEPVITVYDSGVMTIGYPQQNPVPDRSL